MKRSTREADQGGGRQKYSRQQQRGKGAGSRTVVQQNPVLSLHSTRDTDRIIEDSHIEEQEYSGNSEESGEDEHDGSELEEEASNEELMLKLSSKFTRMRIKALKLLLNRLSDLNNAEQGRLVAVAQKLLSSERDKGAKLQADSTEVRVQVYDAISHIIKIGRLSRNSLSDINTIRALMTMSIAELDDRHHRIRSAVLQLVARLAPLLRITDLIDETTPLQQEGYSNYDIQLIVSNYVTDPEPRVRKNACKALLELHRQGFKLALVMYDVAIQALIDDYQEVRMEGLDLIFILSSLYPHTAVQNPSLTQLQATRLVDDAFIRTCDMVNDSSMTVRAKACARLGQFRSVDYKYLSQTFSKQIMAHLRVDVAPKNLAAGPAQKAAQRAKLIATPEGDQDVTAQQVRLLDSGACGAFVHGLEDEYQDVRNAAIDSIRELCLHYPEFSLLALDYMVDMFMDEIDYVRLNALTSLYKIGSKAPITFDTEQLQITLGVLEDADRDVRESTHRMLEVVTMATADGMTSFLSSIESNMKRFPEDQLSIYQCIRSVGRRHGVFIESIVAEMLNLDAKYLPIEQNVEDMQYGGHLILIFNAATTDPRILQMLPKYTFKHYAYLRDKYPNCFPEPSEIPCAGTQPLQELASALTMTIANGTEYEMDVEQPGSDTTQSRHGVASAYATTIAAMRVQTEQDAESFYEQVLTNLDRIYILWRNEHVSQGMAASSARRTLLLQQIAVCQRDLRYINRVHTRQGRNAEFVEMYLECCELLIQIQDSYDTPSFIVQAPILSAQLFRLSYYMDHTFLGLDSTAKVSVGYFRVLANLVWFFGMAQNKASALFTAASLSSLPVSGSGQMNRIATKGYLQSMLKLAIKRVTDLLQQMDQPEVDHQRIQRHRAMLGDLRISLLQAFESPSTGEIIKLMSNIVRFVPMEIDFHSLDLQRIIAQITKPISNRDTPLDIHPMFPFLINVEGMINHVGGSTAGIAVQITFPQGVVRHYYPPPDHFTRMDKEGKAEDDKLETDSLSTQPTQTQTHSYRLRTSIEIYPDATWGSTPTELRITLSRSFRPDLVGHDEFICRFAEEIAFKKRQAQQEQQLEQPSSQSSLSLSSGAMSDVAHLQQPERSTTSVASFRRGASDGHSLVSSGPSSSLAEQTQSTLDISKSVSYYVSRRNIFL
ncbi:Integrator complex subunit 4 [Lobosporangium transversale]|nr:Integrator complex subunit 4 [Lobosporangium transversale]